MAKNHIQKVAIYLRKSRGDKEEDVLKKHRIELTEYADKQAWEYTLYEEAILSGERLIKRPKALQLLDDVENGMYEGVLVKEYERLSRGSSKDFGEIVEVFQYADCVIITPERIYNPNDDNDLTLLGMQSVLSNNELRKIIKRLTDGKKIGTKEGRWTNGKPPYPYRYTRKITVDENGRERIVVEVTVDEEKRKVYNLIKEMYLSGKCGTERISIYLNKHGYPSPGGKAWSTNAVQRILLQEFHMGLSIYGRYEWKKGRGNNRKPTRKRDQQEWFIGKGDWEVLKTDEEHQMIVAIKERNNKVPDRAKQGVFPTSSLMHCKKCGYSMKYSIGRLEAKTGELYNYTKCNHRNPLGETCPQRGVKMTEEFYETLYHAIVTSYLNTESIDKAKASQEEVEKKRNELTVFRKQLEQQEVALRRIKDAYVAGVYNLQEFGEEKKVYDDKIKSIEKLIKEVENEIERETSYTKEELQVRVEDFEQKWGKATTAKEQNELLKTLIKRIVYDREGNEVTFGIEYL